VNYHTMGSRYLYLVIIKCYSIFPQYDDADDDIEVNYGKGVGQGQSTPHVAKIKMRILARPTSSVFIICRIVLQSIPSLGCPHYTDGYFLVWQLRDVRRND